jgi:hypothetical protein
MRMIQNKKCLEIKNTKLQIKYFIVYSMSKIII